MEDEHNPRKARRDKRRVPRIVLTGIDPATIPTSDYRPWLQTSTNKQIQRKICIETGEHDLTKVTSGWRGHLVYCQRCGAFGGLTE